MIQKKAEQLLAIEVESLTDEDEKLAKVDDNLAAGNISNHESFIRLKLTGIEVKVLHQEAFTGKDRYHMVLNVIVGDRRTSIER